VRDPAQIGRYRILEVLETLRSGRVYRARDDTRHRDVALKVLSPLLAAEPGNVALFWAEGAVLSRLRHPNVIALEDLGAHDGLSYMALELLPGIDLGLAVRNGMTLARALAVVRQGLAGLAHVHEQGVVHRNIKPAKLLIPTHGSVRIIDFAVATTDAEIPSSVAGTPFYMSPEQIRADVVDGRTDLFAVGCVLYELATGSRPFKGDTLMDLLYNVLSTAPDLGRLPNGPAWRPFAAVVRRALEHSPSRRYPDAHAMSRDLVEAVSALGAEAERRPALRPPATVSPRPGDPRRPPAEISADPAPPARLSRSETSITSPGPRARAGASARPAPHAAASVHPIAARPARARTAGPPPRQINLLPPAPERVAGASSVGTWTVCLTLGLLLLLWILSRVVGTP
jgi:serine/threonine protein kinase